MSLKKTDLFKTMFMLEVEFDIINVDTIVRVMILSQNLNFKKGFNIMAADAFDKEEVVIVNPSI